MSDVRGALAGLTPEQRALLADRLRQRRLRSATDDRIPPRPDPTAHPLSPAQERLYRLSRLRPLDPVYNLHEATRLRGPLDVEALCASIVEVARRHETLRAVFTEDAGVPAQRIADHDHVDVEIVDVDGGLEAALDIARREAERAFDLRSGPLLRVRVLHLMPDDHVLLVTAHHIVCDGASMGIIQRELGALYVARTTGAPPALDEPVLQYADVAHWQRTRMGERPQRLAYWREQLGPGVQRLRLPGDGRRGGAHTAAGGHHRFVVPAGLSEAITELSKAHRTTPFVTTMAAFLVLLHRHTGQEDLVVCTPVSGRGRRETERMVGFFNNLVVLRGDLSGDPTFADLLRRLQPVVAGAFEHQDVPFQDVATLTHLATTPLARALFVLQDADNRALSLPGVEVTTLDVEAATADFDLGVFVRPEDDRLVGTVRYHTDQFEPEDVLRLLDRFVDVLGAVIDAPDVRASQLPSYAQDEDATPQPRPAVSPIGLPRTPLELQLRDIWQRLFRRTPISVHDDFFELGGHSLLAAELATEIERHITGIPVPLATLFTAPTIAQLALLLDNGGWRRAWASLVPIKPTGSRPPLFFVHAHGGNVIGYRDLARHLPPDQPFYGLQSPGVHEQGTVEPRSIPDIAHSYLAEARSVAPEGPLFFGGWCLGGDIAYEMAVQARDAGLDVPLVVMVDNPRPAHSATSRSGSAMTWLRNRVQTRALMEWHNLNEHTGWARWTHAAQRARHVLRFAAVRVERRVAAALEGTPIHLPTSRGYRAEQIAAAHEKAYQDYDPPRFEGAVALFRAELQPAGRTDDRSLGWAAHVVGGPDVHDVPGHRIGLLSEPRVGAVAARIVEAMDRSLAAPRHGR